MKPIRFTKHARERLGARGATEDEVAKAIRFGAAEQAEGGRTRFRLTVEYGLDWNGKLYAWKQVSPVVADLGEALLVVTVYTYFHN